MKRISINILMCTVLVGLFSACSDEDFSSRYKDPSKTNEVTCDKLLTEILHQGADYTFNSYYNIYYLNGEGLSKYTQTIGFLNTANRYKLSFPGINDRWSRFYQMLKEYRLLEKTYSDLPDISKPDYLPSLLLSKAYLLDHLAQMSDLYGDIPFSKAGYLPLISDLIKSRAPYDKVTDLYQTVLDGLKDCNDQLTKPISSLAASLLSTHDFVNKGNIMKWRRYINSVRLRVALRLSSQGDMAAIGKKIVQDILNDSQTYPVVESSDQSSLMMPDEDGFLKYADEPSGAYLTAGGYWDIAPQAMIKRMIGDSNDPSNICDPRLAIFFDENKNGEYAAPNPFGDSAQQEDSLANHLYSTYDSATFIYNRVVPGIMMNTPEVSFVKAEAYQRGWVQGDAKKAFIDAVTQSIKFYYNINNTATFSSGFSRAPITPPSDAEIKIFANSKWDNTSDKLSVILTQKWISYNWMQAKDNWGQIRRTGIPKLSFLRDDKSVGESAVPEVPNRIRYSSEDKQYNAANYNKVKVHDNFTDKMFWAK